MIGFRFRNFKVYQDAIEFRMKIRQLTKRYFPAEERYWLTDQIIRAANSIVLNIAEGTDRGTDKDFALFLNRSHTSLNEVIACLDIALRENYITLKFTKITCKKQKILQIKLQHLEKNCLPIRQNERFANN